MTEAYSKFYVSISPNKMKQDLKKKRKVSNVKSKPQCSQCLRMCTANIIVKKKIYYLTWHEGFYSVSMQKLKSHWRSN
jgi:hypothetical protein